MEPGYYPDLNRAVARERWGEQYQYLFDNGLEFVWQDMTTPAVAEIYGDMLGSVNLVFQSQQSLTKLQLPIPSSHVR